MCAARACAMQLRASEREGVLDIALDCGFGAPRIFDRAFHGVWSQPIAMESTADGLKLARQKSTSSGIFDRD
jgi:transcriptional regulator GlxA family with amidase domain